MQSINQHLLESITTSQKNSVFHEGFDSISGFLSGVKVLRSAYTLHEFLRVAIAAHHDCRFLTNRDA